MSAPSNPFEQWAATLSGQRYLDGLRRQDRLERVRWVRRMVVEIMLTAVTALALVLVILVVVVAAR